MTIALKNTTVSDIFISDVGFALTASSTYTITPQEYALWSASTAVTSHITSGSVVVVFKGRELLYEDGLDVIGYPSGGWFNFSMNLNTDKITAGRTLVIPADRQFVVIDDITLEGNVEIDGTLGVL